MTGPSTPVVAVLWAVLVLAWAWRHRPSPSRVREVGARPNSPRRAGLAEILVARIGRSFEEAGSLLLRVAGLRAPPERARRVGVSALTALATAPISVLLAPLAAGTVWFTPKVLASRHERRRLRSIAADLPEVVDLLSLAVGSGCTVALAVGQVGRRAAGPLGAELARASAEAGMGLRLADALEHLTHSSRAGESARGLVAALVACERYGAPLAPALERLSAEVRADRRRRTEEAARKVPVKLLFPLVTCTLPAFALLTVAPLIASAVRSLRP